MSVRGKTGKAEWMARADRYPQELTDSVVRDARDRMEVWTARGRVPLRVRVLSRLAGHPVRLRTSHEA